MTSFSGSFDSTILAARRIIIFLSSEYNIISIFFIVTYFNRRNRNP